MLRRVLILAATAYVIVLVVLDLLALIGWPDGGPLALTELFAAHLTLLAIVLVPLAFLHGAAPLRVALVVLLIASVARFGGEWGSMPALFGADGPTVGVMTWNLEHGARTPDDAVAFLRPVSADVVALQELTPEVAAGIAADPALARRFPFQALYPSQDVLGLGLLSAYPSRRLVRARALASPGHRSRAIRVRSASSTSTPCRAGSRRVRSGCR